MGQRSVRCAVLSWILLILVAAGIGWVTTHRQGSGERFSGSSRAVFDEGVTRGERLDPGSLDLTDF